MPSNHSQFCMCIKKSKASLTSSTHWYFSLKALVESIWTTSPFLFHGTGFKRYECPFNLARLFHLFFAKVILLGLEFKESRVGIVGLTRGGHTSYLLANLSKNPFFVGEYIHRVVSKIGCMNQRANVFSTQLVPYPNDIQKEKMIFPGLWKVQKFSKLSP